MARRTKPEPRVVNARDERNRPICGAKTRPGAKHPNCHRRDLSLENGRCRKHGANAGRPASHGRASSLPDRVQAAYSAAIADKSLLDLRHGLAVLDGLLAEYGERARENDSPGYRKELARLWRELRATRAPDGDKSAAGQLLLSIGALIESGVAQDEAFDRLFDGYDRLQKRVEAAREVRLKGQQVLNARDLETALLRFLGELQTGFSVEGIAGEVASRLLDRLQHAIGDMGLSQASGPRRDAIDAAARN